MLYFPELVLKVNIQPAAEQRLELSPRRRCEPWVNPAKMIKPEGATRSLVINPTLFTNAQSRFAAPPIQ
jgi:hypothetical protein